MLSWSRTDEEEAENLSKTEADELGGSWRCRRCKLVCVCFFCFFLKGKADISSPTSARKLKCRRRLQETNPPGSSSVNHSSAGSQHRVINSKITRYFFFFPSFMKFLANHSVYRGLSLFRGCPVCKYPHQGATDTFPKHYEPPGSLAATLGSWMTTLTERWPYFNL